MNNKFITKDHLKSLIIIIITILFVIFLIKQIRSEDLFQGGYQNYFSGENSRVYGISSGPQFNNPNFLSSTAFTSPSDYWPGFNRTECQERTDFVIQIDPGGCSPSVVRSDLLEEQNVPVFCKIKALQVNPLIDVSKIKAIRFNARDYPSGVSGISYYPARAAIGSQNVLSSSPIKDNLGYFVVVLRKTRNESDMPSFITGNMSAIIDYDIEGAFGIGNTNFYVTEISNEEWARDYKQYGFWNGRGYVRLDSVEENSATLSIYKDSDTIQTTINLEKGKPSNDIYLSGFYCTAGMILKVTDISMPVDSALLQINDQQIWVSKRDKIINDKCTITNLESYSGGGTLGIVCSGVRDGKFDLSLTPGKANLSIDDSSKDYVIGQRIIPSSNLFLGYVGQDKSLQSFVVIVNDSFSQSEIGFLDMGVYNIIESYAKNNDLKEESVQKKIVSSIKHGYKTKLKNFASNEIEQNLNIEFIFEEQKSSSGILLNNVYIAKDKSWDEELNPGLLNAKTFYDSSIKNYKDLYDFFPNEKALETEDSYAAKGLFEAAKLSVLFNMNKKALEFFDSLIRHYPDSQVAKESLRSKDLLLKYDSRESAAILNMNNQQYFIKVLDFKKPTLDELSAVFLINGKEEILGLNELYSINLEDKSSGTIKVSKIDDDSVVLEYYKSGTNIFGTATEFRNLLLNDQTSFENKNIKLLKVNLKKQVKLSIIPKNYGPRTESNFSFKIGIEKRGIKLSPQKTKEFILDIENDLKSLEKINYRLSSVIKTLKATCFATAGLLTAKTLVSGLSGVSLARKDVMSKPRGWNDYCKNLISEGTKSKMTGFVYSGKSLQKCLYDHSEFIEKDVQTYSKVIENKNEELESLQKEVGKTRTDVLDFNGQIDQEKLRKAYYDKYFKSFYENNKNRKIILSDGNSVNLDQIIPESEKEKVSLEVMRDLVTFNQFSSLSDPNSQIKNVIDYELGKELFYVYEINQNNYNIEGKKSDVKNILNNAEFLSISGDKNVLTPMNTLTQSDADELEKKGIDPKIIEKGSKVVFYEVPKGAIFVDPLNSSRNLLSNSSGKKFLIVMQKEKNNVYSAKEVYEVNGDKLAKSDSLVLSYLSEKGIEKFIEANPKAYENYISNPEKLAVKYFERDPYKGLPAEVPFDIEKGWYVEMTYILSGFGKPYDESGRLVNYYICNVGPNHQINFKESSDDICRYYNGNSADLNFPGMSLAESKSLINRAQQAVYDAAKQYGKKSIRIGNRVFNSAVSFASSDGACSDFMSPVDCNLLFNVCDPVICPASRCDFGGKFRVDNVISTGILGSLVLCLPNFNENIYVPICLSGVQAGLDGYISILNSTRQCLNESLQTGRNIGICDEIESIYLCEFFWKQATPFMNVLIPRTLELLFSQGTRGGGEYLTVQSAWDNTNAAIDFFKNEYAVNSMQAFKARSISDAGSEVCKSFNSVAYPSSGNFFDRLIEPDSPAQYMGWFSEDILTTATVPSTSHYKVYYHIYSGKDQGTYYSVFLKDIPQSNYIYSSEYYVVDRGYLAKGGQVDLARDFTAVSGYKQLCISINGKEECEFGKVTSSYFLNAISDKYLEEQITTGIRSESECVSGKPSLYSLAQPNLQSGASEIINPELYNQGIIRVCATENPGKQITSQGLYDPTNSTYDRWKQVGYCDDPTIKCFLDTSSVKNVIKNKDILNRTLSEIDSNIFGSVLLSEDSSKEYCNAAQDWVYSSDKNYSKIIKEHEIIDSPTLRIIENLNSVINNGYSNKYRARALYLLANIYNDLSMNSLPKIGQKSENVDIRTDTKPDTKPADEPEAVTPPSPMEKPEIITNTYSFLDFGFVRNGKTFVKVYENNLLKEIEIKNYFSKYNVVELLLKDKPLRKIEKQTNKFIIKELTNEELKEFLSYYPSYVKYYPEAIEIISKIKDSDLLENVVIEVVYSKRNKDQSFENIGVIQYFYSKSTGWKYVVEKGKFVPENIDRLNRVGYVDGIYYILHYTDFEEGEIVINNKKRVLKNPINYNLKIFDDILYYLKNLKIEKSSKFNPNPYPDNVFNTKKIIFEFQDGLFTWPNVFYKYDQEWYYSFSKNTEDFISVSNNEKLKNYANIMGPTSYDFTRSLQSISFAKGILKMTERTKANNEGNIIPDVSSSLVIYKQSESESYYHKAFSYKSSHPDLNSPDRVLNKIKILGGEVFQYKDVGLGSD
jgi:hypothetical protein